VDRTALKRYGGSVCVRVPVGVLRDSGFPFSVGDSLELAVVGDKLVVRRGDVK